MRVSILLGVMISGLAASVPLSTAAAADCANANDQATMSQCADKAFKVSDATLNKLYKQIESRLKDDHDTTKLLVTAQKAWIAFREKECAFSGSASADGSVYPMILAQCRDGMTRDRIKDFQAYLACEEGDLDCPVPAAD